MNNSVGAECGYCGYTFATKKILYMHWNTVETCGNKKIEKEQGHAGTIKNLLEGKNKQSATPAASDQATSQSSPLKPKWMPKMRVQLTPIKMPPIVTPIKTQTVVTNNNGRAEGLPTAETGREIARIYRETGSALSKKEHSQLLQFVKHASDTRNDATNVVILNDEDSDVPDSTRNDGGRGQESERMEPQATWNEVSQIAGPSGLNRPKAGPASKTKNAKSAAAVQRMGPPRSTPTQTSTPTSTSTSTSSKKGTLKRKSVTDPADMNPSGQKQRKSGPKSNAGESTQYMY